MSKMIFPQDIDLGRSPKVRSQMRDDVIAEYAAIYRKDKKLLPPIVLFTNDGRSFLLADGAHRLAAQRVNGYKTVVADVRKGSAEDALAFALTANERHGIRRSREDKRQCIFMAIQMWPTISNLQIAERCSVDDHTVKSVRDEMEKNKDVKPEPVRKSADGRQQPAEKPKEAKTAASSETRTAAAEKSEAVLDALGRPIPKFCLGFWRRSDEIKEVLSKLGSVMSALKMASRNNDIMYAGVNITGTLADLDKSWTSIQTAIPYAVCTTCQGHPNTQPKGECRMCRSKGLISKWLFDTAVPAELKQVLKNQAKK